MKRAVRKAAPAVEPEVTTGPVSDLTPEERAIVARVNAHKKDDWHPIGEDSAIDYAQIGRDYFELPPPAKKMQERRKFAFCWRTRTTARIDELRNKPAPFTWRVCNRTVTPFLKDYVDPVLGCVIREDQVLMYKPWDWYAREQAYKQGLAETHAESGDLQRKHGTEAGESLEWTAGKRKSGKPLPAEIQGGDVVISHETDEGFVPGDDTAEGSEAE